MTTTTIIPPLVSFSFNSKLLSFPTPGIKEPEFYIKIYGKKIVRKYKEGSRQRKIYEEILNLTKELYEWKEAQKANARAKGKEITERPVKPTETINKLRAFVG